MWRMQYCMQCRHLVTLLRQKLVFAALKRRLHFYIYFYEGGAPVKDLEDLAKSDVAMDINTFTALNPDELQVRYQIGWTLLISSIRRSRTIATRGSRHTLISVASPSTGDCRGADGARD